MSTIGVSTALAVVTIRQAVRPGSGPDSAGRINQRAWRSSSARPGPMPGLQVKPVVAYRCQPGPRGIRAGMSTGTDLPKRCQRTSTRFRISRAFPISPGVPGLHELHGICVNRADVTPSPFTAPRQYASTVPSDRFPEDIPDLIWVCRSPVSYFAIFAKESHVGPHGRSLIGRRVRAIDPEMVA